MRGHIWWLGLKYVTSQRTFWGLYVVCMWEFWRLPLYSRSVLVIDLECVHTLSEHKRDTLLNGSQHTYAWRVYVKGIMYYYFNTAYFMEPYSISLHFSNLIYDNLKL